MSIASEISDALFSGKARIVSEHIPSGSGGTSGWRATVCLNDPLLIGNVEVKEISLKYSFTGNDEIAFYDGAGQQRGAERFTSEGVCPEGCVAGMAEEVRIIKNQLVTHAAQHSGSLPVRPQDEAIILALSVQNMRHHQDLMQQAGII